MLVLLGPACLQLPLPCIERRSTAGKGPAAPPPFRHCLPSCTERSLAHARVEERLRKRTLAKRGGHVATAAPARPFPGLLHLLPRLPTRPHRPALRLPARPRCLPSRRDPRPQVRSRSPLLAQEGREKKGRSRRRRTGRTRCGTEATPAREGLARGKGAVESANEGRPGSGASVDQGGPGSDGSSSAAAGPLFRCRRR